MILYPTDNNINRILSLMFRILVIVQQLYYIPYLIVCVYKFLGRRRNLFQIYWFIHEMILIAFCVRICVKSRYSKLSEIIKTISSAIRNRTFRKTLMCRYSKHLFYLFFLKIFWRRSLETHKHLLLPFRGIYVTCIHHTTKGPNE